MKAIWNGQILAEADKTVLVEGNHYFPVSSLNKEFFEDSNHKTHCFWKGEASYYTLKVNGTENKDAAWYYADPDPKAEMIKGHVAFWKGVEVVN